MVDTVTKHERIVALEQLLLTTPDGVSRAEAARRLGVHRSTITRYIQELSLLLPIRETDSGRVLLAPDQLIEHTHFTLHETLALYLALELLTQQLDRRNFHAGSALRKLGRSLEHVAPCIGERIVRDADRVDGDKMKEDMQYLRILEQLTQGWSLRRKVRIHHFSARRGDIDSYLLAPFIILPYPAGRTLHVVGVCDGEEIVRVFRIDRIVQAELTPEIYVIPQDFDPHDHFKDCWGIWKSHSPISQVVLRFSPQVAARVQETVWHEGESMSPEADGSVLWSAAIEEPREMLPWIRGWGCEVEVLAPPCLRDLVAEDVRKMAELYGGVR